MSDPGRGLAGPPWQYLPAAAEVTDQLLAEHPELKARYGQRGRDYGVHDTAFQIAWVATAIELDSPEVLRSNVIWLRDLLLARGFPLEPFRRNLELVIQACRDHQIAAEEDLQRIAEPVLREIQP
ncbi:MAG TPA: hypothetical protein VM305_09685 [Candidatus Limnocylindrales bacterium]|nr:hypothetical protein [Candidatus Limnocylindrales bacterium]